MNWKLAGLVPLVVGLALGQPKAEVHQDAGQMAEVKAILREASALIPLIAGHQQTTAAANIASQQARAGDLETGALPTLRGPDQLVGGVAYNLTDKGHLQEALDLIRVRPPGQEKAVAYWQVVQALLKRAKYGDALSVARLISNDPNETDRFLQTLMQIYSAQWKAGDHQRASETLGEALRTVEREPDISPGMSKPMPVTWVYSRRPNMYEAIVHTLVVAGNPEEARAVFARISAMAAEQHDPEKKKGIVDALAKAQADLGDFRAALKTAEGLKSDFTSSTVMEAIAAEQARQGDPAAALAIAAKLPNSVFALQQIERTLTDAGDFAGARAAVDQMKGPGERAYGLADLAFQQIDKDPEGAKVTVQLAWKATLESRDEAPDYVHENAVGFVATTRSRLGDFSGALEIINSSDLKRKVWPVQNLVQMMVEAGKKDEALALARKQDGPEVKAYGLLEVARSLMDQMDAARNQAERHAK